MLLINLSYLIDSKNRAEVLSRLIEMKTAGWSYQSAPENRIKLCSYNVTDTF